MDVPRLDAWSLHCLVTLVRQSNVTRAGAVLELSQPATSAILARLRDLFQDPILVKSSSGMVPTEQARQIAVRAEQLLLDMRDLVRPIEAVFDASRFVGSVTIAATDVIRLIVMPELLRVLQREAPGLAVIVDNADRTRIHERFERADVDLGMGPRVVSTASLHYRHLWQDDAVCLARGDRAADCGRMPAPAFAELPHIRLMPSKASYFDDLLDKALSQMELRRRIVVSERSFLMVPSLIQRTDLVATVPRRFAAFACAFADVATFELPLALDRVDMGLYWHERTHREPLFRWLRNRIGDVVGGQPAAED